MNLAYLKRKTLKKETYVKLTSNKKIKSRRRTMSPLEKKLYLYAKFITFKQIVYGKLKQAHSSHYITPFNQENIDQNELDKLSLIEKGSTFYQQYKINSLVLNRSTHYNCVFKDEKLINNDEEFLSKYFKLNNSYSLIKLNTKIEKIFIPILFQHGLLINTYLDKRNEFIMKYNEKLMDYHRKGKNEEKENNKNNSKKYTFRELIKAGFDLINNNNINNNIKHSVAFDSFGSSVHDSCYLKSLILNESNFETSISNEKSNLKFNEINNIYFNYKKNSNIQRKFKEEHSIELIEQLIELIQQFDKSKTTSHPKQTIIPKQMHSSFDINNKLMITSLKHKPKHLQKDIITNIQKQKSAKTSRFQSPIHSFKYIPQTPFADNRIINGSKYKTVEDFMIIRRFNDKNGFKKEPILSTILHEYIKGIDLNNIKKHLEQKRIPLKNRGIISNILRSNFSHSNMNNESGIELSGKKVKRKGDLIGERLHRAVSNRNLSRKGEILNKGQLDLEVIGKTEILLDKTQKLLLREDMKFNKSNSFRSMIKIPFLYKQTPRSYYK